MKLSPNFTLEEFTHSDMAVRMAISNEPSVPVMNNLRNTAALLEKVRNVLRNKPIRINSGYRGAMLNKLVKGSSTSKHMSGEAVDFVCPEYGTPFEVAKAIEVSGITFGQLIYEGTWVHLSTGDERECLTAKFSRSGTVYKEGIVR